MFVLPIPVREKFGARDGPAVAGWTLVVLNSGVFLLTLSNAPSYVQRLGFVPAAPSAGTAVTSMFMHSGWMHILGNMMFLGFFGKPVENAIGSVKFVICYVLAGLAAVAVHAATTATPQVPLVGASGAISGVVGMFFAMFPQAPVNLELYLGWAHIKTWRSTGFAATGVWFVEQLALGLISSASGATGIAFWAHVGGFLAGVGLGVIGVRLNVL